jgi:hypothetical protein
MAALITAENDSVQLADPYIVLRFRLKSAKKFIWQLRVDLQRTTRRFVSQKVQIVVTKSVNT